MYGLVPDNDDLDTLSAKEIVARTLFGEASNQGSQGQQAVANVIQNRVKKPGWWGVNFRTVCLKPYQFSCWLSGPDRDRMIAAQPTDPIYVQCLRIASQAIGGQLIDLTGGATSYCTVTTDPPWEASVVPTVVIGQHKFFKSA